MKYVRVRKHEEFQHYKDRTPPWIKLHRCCLTSYSFTGLSDATKWHAIGIALMATETDNHIPADPKWIARHVAASGRVDIDALIEARFLVWCDCSECMERDASATLAERPQDDTQRRGEERRDREEEKRRARELAFDQFWEAYPNKVGKKYSRQCFAKHYGNGMPAIEKVVATVEALKRSSAWKRDNGDYIPNPSTWLNGERWEDEPVEQTEEITHVRFIQ